MRFSKVTIPYVFLIFIIIALLNSGCNNKSYQIKKDVLVPMSDDIRLATDITLPNESSTFPVILIRTPYNKNNEEDDDGKYWAEKGYAFVIQDCRGTGKSEGEWYPCINEKSDGIDTRKWILQQPWCDGNIGTTGGSYLGYTQFVSSTESIESLKAMFPIIPLIDWYNNVTYINGALSVGTVLGWGLEMANPAEGEESLIDEEKWDWDTVYRKLPLIDFDQNVATELFWMRDWIKNPVYNDYWKRINPADIKNNCDIPLITVSGWYDIFINQALDYHCHAIQYEKENQHLVIGPWAHDPNYIPGEREFNMNHLVDLEGLELQWFDIWLKGHERKIDLPPIKLYVMGKNYWREENEWPLKRTNYVNYYFHSEGKANTLNGDGFLSLQQPGKEQHDKFIYDPNNPVPTHGGAILFDEPGIFNQREIEKRNDVLVFTSQALQQELEVTGNIKVILYASTDAKDTDWTAKLLDVYPDGRAFNLCDGVIRARYHKDPFNPQLIHPNQIYEYEIDLWVTSNVYLPGHKIRVEISSSNFPRFDRNPNTGNEFGIDDELKIAKQTVYHDKLNPSHIVLPVIPNSD
jgi:putative CocE/NonD family hydrolase